QQQQEMRRRLFSDPNEGWKPEWAVDGFLFGIDAATLGQGTLFKQGLKGIWNRKGNFIREGEVTTYNDFLRRSKPGDDLEGHHMPQRALLKKWGIDDRDAPVIAIKKEFHKLTRTWGA